MRIPTRVILAGFLVVVLTGCATFAPKSARSEFDDIPLPKGMGLNGWAAAWSKRNVDAYLAYYAKDFKTPKGEPRAEWEQGRRTRVMAPKSISVETDSPKVTLTGDKQASVTFRQRYRSDNINANSMKTLVLVKTDGGWRIQQERVAN